MHRCFSFHQLKVLWNVIPVYFTQLCNYFYFNMQVYDSNHSMPLASEVMITEDFLHIKGFLMILLPNFYKNPASHKYSFYVEKKKTYILDFSELFKR